mgnify:FL=1
MSTKIVIAFVVGVVVGAAASLLLAPKSGEELREELRQSALAEREQLKAEYSQAKSQLQQQMDKVQGDVEEKLAQVKGKAETAVSPE